jgi:proline iminopeptidase
LQRYRIQSHYLVNACFLRRPLLEQLPALPHTPITLVHGTQDRACPPEGTHALAAHWPHAQLHWVNGAGHDAAQPEMLAAWMQAIVAVHRRIAS